MSHKRQDQKEVGVLYVYLYLPFLFHYTLYTVYRGTGAYFIIFFGETSQLS